MQSNSIDPDKDSVNPKGKWKGPIEGMVGFSIYGLFFTGLAGVWVFIDAAAKGRVEAAGLGLFAIATAPTAWAHLANALIRK